MPCKNLYAVYFSPTGGTKNCVLSAAKMFGEKFKEIDLTDFDKRRNEFTFGKDDLVIIGAPVYFGRIVRVENGLFDRLRGGGAKAVLCAVYGNRAYEDALLELKRIAEQQGFRPIAAAALIARHTFCRKAAQDRPDKEDLALLEEFIRKVKAKLADEEALARDLFVKGNYPFRPYGKIPFRPEGDEKCNKCRICFQICPTNAIDAEEPKYTDESKCISCMACAEACPKQARGLHSLKAKVMIKVLERKLSKRANKPEFFL